MAHALLVALGQIDQRTTWPPAPPQPLPPKVTSDARPEVLSLYGASHLILAVAAERNSKRSEAHGHLDMARRIAVQLGEDRDDYGTEFGPINVAIHETASPSNPAARARPLS
ncbi:MAG: hypothetical protein WAN59_12770 [Candidatus Baltobacteraceae bacterium]